MPMSPLDKRRQYTKCRSSRKKKPSTPNSAGPGLDATPCVSMRSNASKKTCGVSLGLFLTPARPRIAINLIQTPGRRLLNPYGEHRSSACGVASNHIRSTQRLVGRFLGGKGAPQLSLQPIKRLLLLVRHVAPNQVAHVLADILVGAVLLHVGRHKSGTVHVEHCCVV